MQWRKTNQTFLTQLKNRKSLNLFFFFLHFPCDRNLWRFLLEQHSNWSQQKLLPQSPIPVLGKRTRSSQFSRMLKGGVAKYSYMHHCIISSHYTTQEVTNSGFKWWISPWASVAYYPSGDGPLLNKPPLVQEIVFLQDIGGFGVIALYWRIFNVILSSQTISLLCLYSAWIWFSKVIPLFKQKVKWES